MNKIVILLFILLYSGISEAGIKYPAEAVTDNDKLEFLYQARESLKDNYNSFCDVSSKNECIDYRESYLRIRQIEINKEVNKLIDIKDASKAKSQEEKNQDNQDFKNEKKNSTRFVVNLEDLIE